MKRAISFLMTGLAILQMAHAQSNTWTGAVSSDWNTAGNWSLGTIPAAAAAVELKAVAGKPAPQLSGNVSIGSLTIYSGSVDIKGYTLTAGTLSAQGALIYSSNGLVDATGVGLFRDMGVYGKLNLRLEYGLLGSGGNNTFYDDLNVTVYPCSPCSPAFWPRGGVYFSYDGMSTFKGNTTFKNEGAGSLDFGIFSTAVVFEKKAKFTGTNVAGSISFLQYGGSAVFKDSVEFTTNNTLRLRGNMEFQGPVKINQSGGEIAVGAWQQYSPSAYMPSLARFKKDVTLNIQGGKLSLGSWAGGVKNVASVDSSARLLLGSQGFTAGILVLANTLLHSASTSLLAQVYPSNTYNQTQINFDAAVIDGLISVRADQINTAWSTFKGRTTLQKGGAAGEAFRVDYGSSNGGNTFKKTAELKNTAGYDWRHGYSVPDVFEDSLKLYFSGNGERTRSGRAAVFKIGMTGHSRIAGPLVVGSAAGSDGEFYFGGTTDVLDIEKDVRLESVADNPVSFNICNFLGTTARTIQLGGAAKLKITNCTLYGPATIQAPFIEFTNSLFLKPVQLTKTGTGDNVSYGGAVFHEKVQFTNTAPSGDFRLLSGEDKLIR